MYPSVQPMSAGFEVLKLCTVVRYAKVLSATAVKSTPAPR